MKEFMTETEVWAALVVSLMCFTGLWRTSTETRTLLRSSRQLHNGAKLASWYSIAQPLRGAGLLLSAICAASLLDVFSLPQVTWVFVTIVGAGSVAAAGIGRTLLGDRVPDWMSGEGDVRFPGFDDSYRRLPESASSTAQGLFESALEKAARSDYVEAVFLYRACLANDPHFVKCMIELGLVLAATGDSVAARASLEDATRVAPASAIAWHLLARTSAAAGDRDGAKDLEGKARAMLDDERAGESTLCSKATFIAGLPAVRDSASTTASRPPDASPLSGCSQSGSYSAAPEPSLRLGQFLLSVGTLVAMWLGYRFGEIPGTAIAFAVGPFIVGPALIIAFPYFFVAKSRRTGKAGGAENLVRGSSIVVIAIMGGLAFFGPDVMHGPYFGWSDFFSPWALFLGCLLAFVRLKQRRSYSELTAGEKLFLAPLGLLWLISFFAVPYWYSDPVSRATSEVNAGLYQQALTRLDRVIAESPNNRLAIRNRGAVRFCSGDLQGALGDFSATINTAGEDVDPTVYLLRGATRELLGDESNDDVTQFVRLRPNEKAKVNDQLSAFKSLHGTCLKKSEKK